MTGPARIVVLASGGGTNFEAVAEHLEARGERRGGEIVLLATDRPGAGALERAARRNIPTATIATRPDRDGTPLEQLLDETGADLVVLAGYLRLVPTEVVRRWHGRIVNVHPALLPAFGGPGMYGLRVHQAVLDAGVKITGVTAHFVDEEYDRGTIIAQWPVPVLDGDDAPTLAARVLRVEHRLFPPVVDALASGRLSHDSISRGLPESFGAGDAFILSRAP